MLRRFSKKRFQQEPEEAIHIMALWNLMIILIPFLLLSAVFSKTAILNVYLPETPSAEQKAQEKPQDPPPLLPMVSILKDGFVIHDGSKVLAAVPKAGDHYDFEKLSSFLLQLKGQIPQHEEIILLSEPDVRYETIIHTMDAAREAVVERQGEKQAVSLFPNVSVGEVGEITFQEVLRPKGQIK